MNGFKLNRVYLLKKKYHGSDIALRMVNAHNLGRATIHVGYLAITAKHVVNGSIVDSNESVIVDSGDYDCFIEYKPFKVNAVYQLRDKYVNMYDHTEYTQENFGQTAFTFTVDRNDHGSAYVCTENGEKRFLIACSYERHMFKRIDNK